MGDIINNSQLIAIIVVVLIIVLGGSVAVLRLRPKRLDNAYFRARWRDTQKLCSKSDTWPMAVIEADKLLDEALKRRHFKGRTMGERMVSAQRDLSNNDGVWFAHKLRNKIVHEEMKKLQQKDVESALKGARQALQDLGAL